MKVRPSIKPIYDRCRVTKHKGHVMATCENLKYRQKRGN